MRDSFDCMIRMIGWNSVRVRPFSEIFRRIESVSGEETKLKTNTPLEKKKDRTQQAIEFINLAYSYLKEQ